MVLRRVGSQSALPALLGLAALLSGCVGADGPTRPSGEDGARLAVSARFAVAPAAQADAPAEIQAEAAWSLEPAIDVAAGDGFACGLNEHGQVFCWGVDVGDDATQSPAASTVPVPMGADFRLASLSAGERHVCGLADAGEAYCWGWNGFGQLGDGTTADAPEPVPVSGGLTFASLDAGATHNCALTPDGTAYCWGAAGGGQDRGALGFDAPDLCNDAPCSTEPGPVVEAGAFDQVSAGFEHTCGVGTDGTGYCWGSNFYYQLGLGSSVPDFSVTPQAVTVVSDFRELRAGTTISCGVDAAGAAHCWGSVTGAEPLAAFDVGQLGDGKLDGNARPEPVIGGVTFRTLAVSQVGDLEAMVTCGIATDAAAYCWGANQHGQLGAPGGEICMPLDTQFDCRSEPAPVSGGHAFLDLAVGLDHVCGVSTGGVVYCWGNNATGQLGDGSTAPSQAPVRVAAPSETVVAARAPTLRLRPVRR